MRAADSRQPTFRSALFSACTADGPATATQRSAREDQPAHTLSSRSRCSAVQEQNKTRADSNHSETAVAAQETLPMPSPSLSPANEQPQEHNHTHGACFPVPPDGPRTTYVPLSHEVGSLHEPPQHGPFANAAHDAPLHVHSASFPVDSHLVAHATDLTPLPLRDAAHHPQTYVAPPPALFAPPYPHVSAMGFSALEDDSMMAFGAQPLYDDGSTEFSPGFIDSLLTTNML